MPPHLCSIIGLRYVLRSPEPRSARLVETNSKSVFEIIGRECRFALGILGLFFPTPETISPERLNGHMSDDVEHFNPESCTCHVMSSIAFSVTKMSSRSTMPSRFRRYRLDFTFNAIMSNSQNALWPLTFMFGIIWHLGVRHHVAVAP